MQAISSISKLDLSNKMKEMFVLSDCRFKVIYVSPTEMQSTLFDKIENSSFKGCLLQTKLRLWCTGVFQSRDFNSFEVFYMSYNKGIGFSLSSFLYSSFNDHITRFIEGGLFNYWMGIILNRNYFSIAQAQTRSSNVVLTVDHLLVGFQIWLCTLLLPIIAFVGEIFYFWLPKTFKHYNNQITKLTQSELNSI